MVARGEPRVSADDAPRILAPADEVLADDSRRPAAWHGLWRGAFLSLLLHVAIIAALLGLWRLPAPHEVILQVALVDEGPGAAGAAGGTDGRAATPGRAPAETPAAPSATSASTEAPTEANRALAAPPQPASPPEAPAPPVPAAAAPKPPPRPQHKPAPPARPAAPVTAAAEPPPTPAAVSSQPPSADATAATAPPAAGVGRGPAGPSGVGKGAEGQGHGVVGNGPPEGPGDDYLNRLRRWLAKYKKYPEDALKRKVEGEVVVAFTLARDGTVLAAQVEKSSGSATLDEAAVRMLHDASPVPPVPERYKGRELRLTIPVDYSIGFFERLFR
jgi:protein TonB